ncbi:LacI family DNA-binding transcriptional regulator [Plantactinospora endophytica]|uniref:LacI family transcriptional regulator n=1 Tax=Plantactinospora endophytica TaxID=673535 RepID=A0ABQ4E005_9ACTN|nr:LacI family DNA-binding transcriptional regulator [Plantactinospora endophytica]GIG88001.1 LacI family transcriptional regulator [Plantactinospora endophytica]
MPRPRIADVAEIAGVSPTTVSHALSGRRPVSAEARERVQAAVKELNYRANQLAVSLRTQRTQTVAFVMSDITNPFYPMVARGVQDAISDAGYQVVVCSTDGDAAREAAFITDMVSRAVDGLIIDLFRTPAEALGGLLGPHTPVVMLGPMKAPPIADRVHGDDRVSVAEATRHLLRQGRTRIAFVGATGIGPAAGRLGGYEDALLGAGLALDPKLVIRSDYTRRGARAAVAAALADDPTLDAIVCVNDLAAIGAIDALQAAGRTVPDDVAVTGFDDIDAAALVRPALTTIDNRAYEKGTVCGRLLLQRITGELDGPVRDIVVPGALVVRESA